MEDDVANTEMLVVDELYREAVKSTDRRLIIFNGELDRIRSGCILFDGHCSGIFLNSLDNKYTHQFT